jgi:RNA polymerase sigma-70 factor (ECF subfamily)
VSASGEAVGPSTGAGAATAPDPDSSAWLAALRASGATRDEALERLHGMLVRVALREAHRRSTKTVVTGPELDDLAHQAAADAMVSILAKLDTFRGESRFTTWVYRFVVLEVSSKLGRHHWRKPTVFLDVEDWERLPDRFGLDPDQRAEQRELIDAVRRAVDETLTDWQRKLFVAIVVNAVPLDAVVAQSGSSRGAIYKAIFDARRKIRAFLVANGYLRHEAPAGRSTGRRDEADRS